MTGPTASLLPLANGIESLFWVVVVVGSIIAQIAKAARKAQSQRGQGTPLAPREGPDRLPSGSPEDELRQFLESLGGGQPRQVQGPPPPPPRELRPHAAPTAPRPRSAPPVRRGVAPVQAVHTPRPPRPPRPAARHSHVRTEHLHVRTEHRHTQRARVSVLQHKQSPAAAPARRPPAIASTAQPAVRVTTPQPQAATAPAQPTTTPAGNRPVLIARKSLHAGVLRAAVVWREILSPPIALRRPSSL
jgi:hypothetical protein